MTVVAVLFIVLMIIRVVLYGFDIGFGGPVWTTIMYVSSLAWVLGLVLALHVLGLLPRVVWP